MALNQLITAAVSQYRAFGLLADRTHPAFPDDLTHFIRAHGHPFSRALATVDNGAPYQAVMGLPFLLCSSETAPEAPPGGYYGRGTILGLGSLLASRYEFWQKQKMPEEAGNILIYLQRAALYVLHMTNFNTSVRYLLDLQKHGFLLEPDPIALKNCLIFLFQVRQRVASDDDIVSFCLGNQPHNDFDWYTAELLPVNLAALRVLRDGADGIAYLLQTAEKDIDEVRAAQSYDEWVLGQHYLFKLMQATIFTLRTLDMDQETAFKAFDIKYEEIAADCGAYTYIIKGAPSRYPFEFSFNGAHAAILAAQMGGGNWQDRICEERVLVPDQLADLLLPNDDTINLRPPRTSVPAPWHLLSSTVAPVYAAVVMRNSRYRSLIRPDAAQAGQAPAAPVDMQLLVRTIRENPENRELLDRILATTPYSDQHLLVDAISFDLQGEPEVAMARTQQAILIDPSNFLYWSAAAGFLDKLGDLEASAGLASFARTLRNERQQERAS
ncbi:hypothetical protein GTP58_27585 [Duganella sp. CY15W]|uniref:hypothetical protein n=1 Tax=Duganella sp. CY15W TaxID=2692172 RepID=UPI00136EA242|nr:hypothetical protein [Duganella sp. CY15W]MYM32100.1 hypothetical protein [Duganella sp. CY15W]